MATRTASLRISVDGPVLEVVLSRPTKRNALDDDTIRALEDTFRDPPDAARVAVLRAEGGHFSAGLDLGALTETFTFAGVAHSRMWHRAFEAIEFGRLPVVATLHGAVIGGGLELAAACHLRVADRTTFYALPEGQRGLFVGGGGSVRVQRLVGRAATIDLMLTGRVLDADDGHRLGLAQYLVDDGQALTEARRLAAAVAGNAPATSWAVLQVLPRIEEAPDTTGYLLESLTAAVCQGCDDAKQRLQAFLDGRAERVRVAASGDEGAEETR